MSSYKEPVAGWINNVYGPTGAFYGIALGLIRVMLHDKKCEANIVPVDMCMNALIVSAWDIAKKFEKAKDENGEFQTPVYNYGSSDNKVFRIGGNS